MERTLILDNGSFTIKSGYAEDRSDVLRIPNTVTRTKRTKRVYVGDLIDVSNDLSGLYYRSPFERGYLVRWDAEISVWDRAFSNDVLGCTPYETNLVISEPVFNFKSIQKTMDEILFEEYEFNSVLRAPSTRLACECSGEIIYGGEDPECVLVVDVGHAFTYVVPYCNKRQVEEGIRRLDIGGRILTNYLKETVSFRYWDMMDETYIMNAVKEKCCFVSGDFYRDLEMARGGGRHNPLCVEYVLPDFTCSKQGFVKGTNREAEEKIDSDMQILPLCNERFAIPEALFNPSDLGLEQGGIHETIMQAVDACPHYMRGVLLSNVLLVGGSASLPGLKERMQAEVQSLSSQRVHVSRADKDPDLTAWMGGSKIAQSAESSVSSSGDVVADWALSREQYREYGADRTLAHFSAFI